MHSANREKLCVICFSYKSRNKSSLFRSVFPSQTESIRKWIPSYSFNDPKFPSAICTPCRFSLLQNKRTNITVHEYNNTSCVIKEVNCRCSICEKVKASAINPKQPVKSSKKTNKINKTSRCSKCCTLLGRGKRHVCNKENFIKNVLQIAETNKTKEIIASTVLQEKRKFEDLDENDSYQLRNRRGKSSYVQMKKGISLNPASSEFIMETQQELNLSDFQTIKLTRKFKRQRYFSFSF